MGQAAAQADYADSVDRALQLVRNAPAGDREAARRAAAELEAGTGDSQPEILADLRRDPPDLGDARARLAALAQADRSPAFTPEPSRARRSVHDILAQPRYASLRAGPSPGDRLRDLLLQLLVWALERVARGGDAVLWLLGAGGAVALAAVAFSLLRTVRGRSGVPEARLRTAAAPEPVRDRFAEADRLAALGELTAAVRALAGAVAAALGDQRDWERSPLTVREIFGRAPEAPGLRPLLLVFEAAVYGARPPSREDYERAAAAAARFRPRAAAAA